MEGLQMYTMFMEFDWSKHSVTTAIISGAIILLACFMTSRKTYYLKSLGLVITYFPTLFFIPAIYKISHPAATNEDIQQIVKFLFPAMGLAMIPAFLVIIYLNHKERLNEKMKKIKALVKAVEDGTSKKEDYEKWKELIKEFTNIFDLDDKEQVEELKKALAAFETYISIHFEGEGITREAAINEIEKEDTVEKEKSKEWSPYHTNDPVLDSKASCIIQLIVSVVLFFVGDAVLMSLLPEPVEYNFALFTFELMIAYAASSLVSALYYGYVYSIKFLANKEDGKTWQRVLVYIIALPLTLQLIQLAGMAFHPHRVIRMVKTIFFEKHTEGPSN